MVSVREIRRLIKEVMPERQLPFDAILEFQLRSEQLLKEFITKCNEEAGVNTKTRLSSTHIRVAYLLMMDRANEREGEWNE